jgi:uncharacterized membrane protein YeiH
MTMVDIATYIGTFVFALTGAFKARSYKMDIFGGLVLAFITAYGGGTIRDLLIGRTPINWINDNAALALVVAGTIFTFLMKEGVNNFKKTIFITDAIGLGLFTITGTEIAMQYGLNEFYALIMGVISATFGGLIADIISNNIPSLLTKGELYATACALGCGIYLLLKLCIPDTTVCFFMGIAIISFIRIYSVRKQIQLPKI